MPVPDYMDNSDEHEAMRVNKAICVSSPHIYKIICKGETFNGVQIQWYKVSDAGAETKYFRHKR